MKILITGSLGLVGLAATKYFLKKNHTVVDIDNNMRQVFFGKEGSTKANLKSLSLNKNYIHYSTDIYL